jgi:hypothetical protein
MIDRDHELPVSRQCAALGISRGSVYYEAVSVSESDLTRSCESWTSCTWKHPHAGSRRRHELPDRYFAPYRAWGNRWCAGWSAAFPI